MGEKQKAVEYFNQALPLRQASGDKPGEARTLYWIARSERDGRELSKALASIEAALRIVETMRGRIASQVSRTSYFQRCKNTMTFILNYCLSCTCKTLAQVLTSGPFMSSENARARGLVDLLRESHADIRRGADPALLERERRLQQQSKRTHGRAVAYPERRTHE